MEHKFSLLKYMALSLVIVISTIANVHADSETEVFVSNINSNWTQRQYTNILNAIDNRLASQTNDILALGLKVGYYYWAEVDLDQAKLAASNFGPSGFCV